MTSRTDINRAWWDERVPIHVASDVLRRRGVPPGRLDPAPVRARGGRRRGRQAARPPAVPLRPRHALLGARAAPRWSGSTSRRRRSRRRHALADETGLDARFVVRRRLRRRRRRSAASASTSSTPASARSTGCPTCERWAAVVAELLAPGGFLYLSEFHPFTWVFGDDDLTIEHDYFHDPAGVDARRRTRPAATRTSRRRPSTTPPASGRIRSPTWSSAVLGAGLRLELLHEHDYTLFRLRFEAIATLDAGDALPVRRRLPLCRPSARRGCR